jgi:hypothetical protein
MSAPTTTKEDDLQSRLPDPIPLIPEVAQVAGAMARALRNDSIPLTTISLVQLRAGQVVRQHVPHHPANR